MITETEFRKFDFREIAALDDTAVLFRNWIAKSSSFFSDFWSEATGGSAAISLGQVRTLPFGAVLETIPQDRLYSIASINERISTIWFASGEELGVTVSEMLCLPTTSDAIEGDLSAIELSLAQLFVDELAKSLVDGWIGDLALEITTSDLVRDPRKTKLFRRKDLVTQANIEVDFQNRRTNIHLLLPKQKTCELLESAADRRTNPESIHPSEQLIGQLPLDIVAVIGQAKLPMLELSELRPGQVVKLDQRIDQPIVAYVNDAPFYECWPGRYGRKQSLEIHSCLSESPLPIGGQNE